MSSEIVYLLNLHKEGKIDDSALNKALNALQPSTQNRLVGQDEPSIKSKPTESSKVLENIRQKRREKKKRQKQRHTKTLAEETATALEENQSEEHAEASQNSKLVDKPLCNYFKTYEINAEKYKNPSILFEDKKSIIIDQLKKDLGEYKGIKFSVGLSLEIFKDEKNGTRKYFQGQRHGEQTTILDEINADKYYDEQVAYINAWIENFTSQEGTGAVVNHCLKLYLNIAKYEPLKGSSYIPLPNALANKKAIINVKKRRQ